MDEKRGVSSEPASISPLSGEKRKGSGSEEKDELVSKRAKARDLDSDTKSSNMQSDTNTGLSQQQKLTSVQVLVAPPAAAKDVKPSTFVKTTNTCLPKACSVSKDDNRLVANSGKQALPEKDVSAKDDSKCEALSKNSSVLKPRDVSESVAVSPRDPSEKAGPFQGAEGSLEKSDSMRRWMEMKRNGFLSGPLGGVSAPPSSAATTAPVEVPPAQKQQKSKRRSDSLKKRNEAPRKEQQQQQVDRFSNVTAPSGLLTELNPGIINHVRSKKQVCSIIEALIRNATVGERNDDLNVRGSVREDKALAFKLPSSGASAPAHSYTNPEQATCLAVQAATVASQWLDFLHQDLSGRLAAVQESKKRVHNILTAELPLLVSSKESSSVQESTPHTTSDKTVTETHHIKWSAKFDQIKKALYDEEKDLERSLNQVKEMQSRCNEGLRQMDEFSPFSSQSSDSSIGKDGSNMETTSMAVQAAAASIFSTCSFLLSMMKPPATSS